MPIYEYYCPENHRVYQFFARSIALAGAVPRCPDNPAWTLRKEVSAFAFTGRHREEPKAGGEGMGEEADDPRLDAAMDQLEREMDGIDDENPDPRRLGHLLRRMSELTGEKMPGTMQEMVRRLEAGEDPEKLEDEYGDALDEPAEGDSGADGTGDSEASASRRRTRRAAWRAILRARAPSRDPRLYELAEWL